MKLTKKIATEFCKKVLGTSKGLEAKEDFRNTYYLKLGEMTYQFYLINSRIYMTIYLNNLRISSNYFNLETLEHDSDYDDKLEQAEADRASAEDRIYLLEYLKDNFSNEFTAKLETEVDRLIEKYEGRL